MTELIGFLLFAICCFFAAGLAFHVQKQLKLSQCRSLPAQAASIRFANKRAKRSDPAQLPPTHPPQRNKLSGLAAFGFSFANLPLLIGAAFMIAPAVAYAGPIVIGVGWPLLAFFSLIVACSVASLASAVPKSGGCYHWSAVYIELLLPRTSASHLQRIQLASGWLFAAGQILILSSVNLMLSSWLSRIVAYWSGADQAAALFWLFFFLLAGTQLYMHNRKSRVLGQIFAGSAWITVAAIAVIVASLAIFDWPGIYPVRLLYMPQHPANIFTAGSPATSFLLGLMLLLKVFIGAGSAAQLAEETAEPRLHVPWAIYLSVVYAFIFGFVLFAILLLYLPDMFAGQIYWLRLTDWLVTRVSGTAGWLMAVMIGTITASGWCCGLSALTAAARMWHEMAKDGVLPQSARLSQLSRTVAAPSQAACCAAAASASISVCVCLSLGWEGMAERIWIAFAGLSIIVIHLAYLLPIACKRLAYRKARGCAAQFEGPWRLGKGGLFIDLTALCWLTATIVGSALLLPAATLWWGCGMFVLIGMMIEYEIWRRPGNKTLSGSASTIAGNMPAGRNIRIERKFPQ
ncbi:amino acid permease [Paenibacillus sp. GCM10027626]|uniref:amino acid permease n=1 Tax=Paenibacillus sp. GCM10027626 TaxID=3273411 RepID=UPI0036368501